MPRGSAVVWILMLAPALVEAQQYRAFWADAFHYGFKTPQQIDRMIEDATAAKCNAIFAEIRRRGDSYYLNSLEPPADDPDYAPGFDALQYLIDHAHPRNIEVHAWFPITPLWSGSKPPANPEHLWYQHGPNATGDDMWMTVDSTGNIGTALDPGHPAAFQYLLDLLLNVAAHYEIDGIHLDYIRYPETAVFGYNPVALGRFQRLYNRTDVPTALDANFSDFRRQQVTALVRQLYLRTFALKPAVKISAAVITWGNGPLDDSQYRGKDAFSRVFQDWRGWLEEGIVDIAVPMNYFRESQYPTYLDRWLEYEKDRQYGRMVLPGLAIYLNSIPDSLAQARRVVAPSAAGNIVAGVSLYSYASTNILDSAGLPVTPNAQFYEAAGNWFGAAATVPDLPWKSNPTTGHLYGWLHVDDGPAWRKDGLTVIVESDTGGSFTRQTMTDATGFFGAVDLPPDRYRVRFLKGDQEFMQNVPQDVTAGVAQKVDVFLHDSDIP